MNKKIQYKRKPTTLQNATVKIQIENPKLSKRKAMMQAGYSEATASHPKQNYVESRGVQEIRKTYKDGLAQLGINEEKLAEKSAEWLDAKKTIGAKILVTNDGSVIDANTEGAIEVPDYQTQIKAGEMIRKDLGLEIQKNDPTTLIQQYFNISTDREKYQ